MTGRDLVLENTSSVAEPMEPYLRRAADYARAEKAMATRKAYRTDYVIFSLWCEKRGLSGLPASYETVAAYLAYEADRGAKASTIGRRCAAIRYAHTVSG